MPKDVRPGAPMLASEENELRAEVRRLSTLRGGPGVSVRRNAGGFSVSAPGCRTAMWIRITGAYSGGYPWEEVERSGGTWVATGTAGSSASDPAFEQNGDTSIASGTRRYPAERSETTGEVIFINV